MTQQGAALPDFPSGTELDAVNGVVNEDAAIEITRKLVVDSLKASMCFVCWAKGGQIEIHFPVGKIDHPMTEQMQVLQDC